MDLPASFTEKLNPNEQALTQALCDLIELHLPECRFKLSYGVPYFYHHRRVCFVWPASVNGSNLQEGVLLGFCEGHLMADPYQILEKGKRKQVYWITYKSLDEIDPQVVQTLLMEAIQVDRKWATK